MLLRNEVIKEKMRNYNLQGSRGGKTRNLVIVESGGVKPYKEAAPTHRTLNE